MIIIANANTFIGRKIKNKINITDLPQHPSVHF